MAKKKKQQDFDALAHLFDTFPHGASLSEIEAKAEIPRRTLVRRLAEMVEAGIIVKSGARRGVRYHRPGMPPQEATDNKKVQPDLFVPLSKAGGEVFRLVSRPLHLRTPVSYNREFLERYQPNQSNYLTNAEKAHLHELGRTSGENEPAGTYAQHVLNRLLIDLSWNSSRLEGNTYSLLDTQRLIELGEPAEEKAATDAQMILNHKAAIEFLVQSADEVNFNRSTILNLHALLADNLLANPNAAGRLRSISVAITKSVYLPLAVPQLIEECFLKLLGIAAEIQDPFEQALFVMVQIPYLQPFDDVNKRVSRLAANMPMIRHNLAPVSFVDVPDSTYTQGLLGVYELNRIELIKDVFLWAYERSARRYAVVRQSLGAPDPFRLRHRAALREVVAHVVHEGLNQKNAAAFLQRWANESIPDDERARFVEIAETELLSLHEGNFARYRIRPSQFKAWQAIWNVRSG